MRKAVYYCSKNVVKSYSLDLFIHLSSVSVLSWVRVMIVLELIRGTLGTRWEYSLDGMHIHALIHKE